MARILSLANFELDWSAFPAAQKKINRPTLLALRVLRVHPEYRRYVTLGSELYDVGKRVTTLAAILYAREIPEMGHLYITVCSVLSAVGAIFRYSILTNILLVKSVAKKIHELAKAIITKVPGAILLATMELARTTLSLAFRIYATPYLSLVLTWLSISISLAVATKEYSKDLLPETIVSLLISSYYLTQAEEKALELGWGR